MVEKQIVMFKKWAEGLRPGTEGDREAKAVKAAIRQHFNLGENSELVMMCWAFCAGAAAATESKTQNTL